MPSCADDCFVLTVNLKKRRPLGVPSLSTLPDCGHPAYRGMLGDHHDGKTVSKYRLSRDGYSLTSIEYSSLGGFPTDRHVEMLAPFVET